MIGKYFYTKKDFKMIQTIGLQIKNGLLSLTGKLINILIAILVGATLVYIPEVKEFVAQYTDLHIAAILAMITAVANQIRD